MPGNVPIKLKDSSCPKQFTCTIAYIASASASLFLLVLTQWVHTDVTAEKKLGSLLLALKSSSPISLASMGKLQLLPFQLPSLPQALPAPLLMQRIGKNEVGFMLGQGCSTSVIYCSNHPTEPCFPQIAHINYQLLLPLSKVNATSCFTGRVKFRG